jgi:hypothetical protein
MFCHKIICAPRHVTELSAPRRLQAAELYCIYLYVIISECKDSSGIAVTVSQCMLMLVDNFRSRGYLLLNGPMIIRKIRLYISPLFTITLLISRQIIQTI